MTDDRNARWQEIDALLDRLFDAAPERRDAILREVEAENPALAHDARRLVAVAEEIDLPPGGALATSMLRGIEPSPPAPDAVLGKPIGPWRLVGELGQGGMGRVYLAERADGEFEQRVALKLLPAGPRADELLRRFEQERRILARLDHPHIARLLDGGTTEEGRPWFAMELVDGARIDDYCDGRRLNVDERLRLFVTVADAVQAAHRSLVIHRDLKPANILVTLAGEVKLLDFGIAKPIDADGQTTDATRTLYRVLTPSYATPEQIRGEPLTTASDVYQLGLLLYELLTGRRAQRLKAATPQAIEGAVCETPPTRPSQAVLRPPTPVGDEAGAEALATARDTSPRRLARRLRGDLDIILLTALRKEPERRYTSAERMAADVRRHLAELPITARPDSLTYWAHKFVRRHALGVAAASAVALLLAGLIGFYTIRLATERDRARFEAAKSAKVSELLSELLAGADPYGDPKEEPTVRAVLDAAAARLPDELAGQHELRAEMLTVLGRTYERLGLHDRARPLLEEALAAGRLAFGAEHPHIAQSLNDLGVLARMQGDIDAAVSDLDASLAMRRQLLGPAHKDIAVTLVELGRAYSDRGQYDRAEPLFREALAMRRRLLGDEHRETATSLSDLAFALRDKGDVAGAEALFRQVVALNRKVLGDNHPNTATSLNNLALMVGGRGDHAGAEALLREALAIDVRTLGPAHPALATRFNNLSNAVREQGRIDEAEDFIQRALAIAESALGAEHPLTATCHVSHARVLLAQGRPAQAESVLRQVLQIRRRVLPDGDWTIGTTKSLLGVSLTALGRYEEAEPLLVQAHRSLNDIAGQQGRDARATIASLIALYEAWGRPEQAVPYRVLDKQE
ncbi:MAG: tetratricopeptide repeat protein [Thermoanaerobaculia bacterium]